MVGKRVKARRNDARNKGKEEEREREAVEREIRE